MKLIFSLLILLLLPLMERASAQSAGNQMNILVINSYHSLLPWTQSFNQGVHDAISNNADLEYRLFFESIDVTQSESSRHPAYNRYLREKYRTIKLDAVIADGGPASDLVRSMGIWGALIQIHSSLDRQVSGPRQLSISNHESHVIERTLDMIVAQVPQMKRLIVVASGTPVQRGLIPTIEAYMARYPEVALQYHTQFRWENLLASLGNLGNGDAVFYGAAFADISGRQFIPREALAEIVAQSAVPVFATDASYLGTGIVGGHLQDARVTGSCAMQAVLDFRRTGQFSSFYPVSQPYLDITAARRYGLSIDATHGVTGVNPPPNWFERNQWTLFWILWVIVLILALSLFWNTRLRQLVNQLNLANIQLKQTQQALSDSNKELHTLSRQDSLTGLFNRRAMLPVIDAAISERSRYDTVSTLMLLDLDDFKDINDQFGHNVGDMVLKSMSFVLKSVSRRTDTVSRWGGEEFLILAKGISETEAFQYLEKVRQQIALTQTINEKAITFSAGLCEIRSDHNSDSLVAEADQAMYEAKRHGKNQTRIWRLSGLSSGE